MVISPTPSRWPVVFPSSRIRIWMGPSWMASPPSGATTETCVIDPLLVDLLRHES